jgi:hypothetical protein
MIGSHNTPEATPDKLRKAVKAASRKRRVVTLTEEVLQKAGLPYGSCAFKTWAYNLPNLDWHARSTIHQAIMLHFTIPSLTL